MALNSLSCSDMPLSNYSLTHSSISSPTLLPSAQSAYQKFHSTETALANVLSDILMALDQGNVAALALLDLSTVFYTVDHRILLRRLCESYGIGGMVLSWITSYLTDRQQHVCHARAMSTSQHITFGVPQSSVLGPLLFVLYTADLASLIHDHRLHPHLYADDTQVYGWCRPTDVNLLKARMSHCIDDVWSWTRSNRLQLHPTKTEFVWCAPSRRRHHIPTSDELVCNDPIHPLQSVEHLGMYVDGAMTMRTHINHVLSCFSALRQVKSIKQSLPAHALTTLVTALVHSRLDYCNVVFAGLPNCDIQCLQSVLNTLYVWSMASCIWHHFTRLLRDHHWLPVKQHIEYKLCMTVHRCLHGEAQGYLADLITPSATATARAGLRSATSGSVAVLRHHLVTARSLWPLRHQHLVELILLTLSNAN